MTDTIHIPAEFTPHSRTLIAWPYRPDVWRDNAEPARKAFEATICSISRFEPVTLICHPDHLASAKHLDGPNVEVIGLPYDDSWMRDIGPWFGIKNGKLTGISWDFNSWGGLLDSCENDNHLASLYCEKIDIPCEYPGIVMEGGAVTLDGKGTLITTKQCLLNQNRNPDLRMQDIEDHLRQYTGCLKFIWLETGLVGDTDTDGHVDNLCTFLSAGQVAVAWTDDPDHPQYHTTHDAVRILESSTDAQGNSFEIVKLICPPAEYVTESEAEGLETNSTYRETGMLLPASYANLYLCNGAIIAPGLGHPEYDALAVETLSGVCPEREIVQVATHEILLGGGNIHCITMQMPKIA